MNFDFFMPAKLITGENCVANNAGELAGLGGSCLIVTSGSGKKSGALDDVIKALQEKNITYTVFDRVEPNPSLETCKTAGDLAREAGAEFIVGIGGGSPLDAAKAAAVYAANPMELMDLYKLDWKNPALPIVLVGTTAGTGSEVSATAVLTNIHGRKKSITHPECFATLIFGDARYTRTLPLSFTVSTALDALSHALEGYFSTAATELSDLFAVEAVKILAEELPLIRNIENPEDITLATRERLYYASILAGLTLARCGTCYCHPLGYYLTEQYDTPHGTACAVFLSDFLHRESRLMPEKADRLFRSAGTDEAALCGLIDMLCADPGVKMAKDDIAKLAAECAGLKNFSKTAPDGYTEAEAAALLTRLFG